MSLHIVPLTLEQANRLVEQLHRHHNPAVGHRWSLGAVDAAGILRGAAIASRPVSRMLDDGQTVEITRLATDGTANACSILYGAMRRVAREMGYARIITYTLQSESGTSLRAAGWTATLVNAGGSWSVPSRPRQDKHPLEPKVRWECAFRPVLPRTRPTFGEETA